MIKTVLARALFALIPTFTQAADAPALGHTADLVIRSIAAKSQNPLMVTSPSFIDQADMPFENTQYRGNHFPGLQWSEGPDGIKSYVVIMQGAPDRVGAKTSIHLVLFNIPATVHALAPDMITPPEGAVYGPNVHGQNQPYAGPHTHTLAKQAYHLQVFALDVTLSPAPDQSFEAIAAAMRGHVLADGDLVGYAAMDPQSPEARSLPPTPAH